jgi:deoxyribodipyrimidine photo-lyase
MLQLVWYKRDLRVHDHEPLTAAAARGPVLPLYIVEPSFIHAHNFSPIHWTFIRESLLELGETLARLGQPLIVRVGEATEVLHRLATLLPISALWAHEETSTLRGYARDQAVRRWARAQHLPFTELPQNGVIRRLPNRDQWDTLWEERMAQPLHLPPEALRPAPQTLDPGPIPTHAELGLEPDTRSEQQPAGERIAHGTLDDFLTRRGARYNLALSSPLSAWEGCSRLSPHLAWGTLSIRQVVRATRARVAALQAREGGDGWLRALNAFESRLHWHCHFIQKIEDEPEIEEQHFVRAYDGMRPTTADSEKLTAWAAGVTGYPFVDACMRALTATGWLNFRMRAMLVSFACYDLWQHWREPGYILARRWVDYEPGIHYCQLQMQSGTAGNSTIRIYNPTKQGQDQDPQGVFIRRWVPELEGVSAQYIHAPWLMPREIQQRASCLIGKHYPAPIVDHEQAQRKARAAIAAVRARPATSTETAAVRERHGSRRTPPERQSKPKVHPGQLRMEL